MYRINTQSVNYKPVPTFSVWFFASGRADPPLLQLKQDRVKAAYIEEEIVPEVVADNCLLAVWELLVHTGRTLDSRTFQEVRPAGSTRHTIADSW